MNTTGRTRRHAYVDESKAKDYLLVSVALDSGSLHHVRGTVRSMILPARVDCTCGRRAIADDGTCWMHCPTSPPRR